MDDALDTLTKLMADHLSNNIFPFFSGKFQNPQSCDCVSLQSCKWSLDAFNKLQGLPKNNPKRKTTIEEIQKHICDAKTRSVYCCGPEEQPPGKIQNPTG